MRKHQPSVQRVCTDDFNMITEFGPFTSWPQSHHGYFSSCTSPNGADSVNPNKNYYGKYFTLIYKYLLRALGVIEGEGEGCKGPQYKTKEAEQNIGRGYELGI